MASLKYCVTSICSAGRRGLVVVTPAPSPAVRLPRGAVAEEVGEELVEEAAPAAERRPPCSAALTLKLPKVLFADGDRPLLAVLPDPNRRNSGTNAHRSRTSWWPLSEPPRSGLFGARGVGVRRRPPRWRKRVPGSVHRFPAAETSSSTQRQPLRGGCTASKPVRHLLHAAIHDRRRMRQYGCEQEGTKASSRRDADAARDARGRCAPRRPRPRARNVRGGRATCSHVSRSSRGNRSDGPRSQVTPARMPSCARCRSRTARVSRSIVSSSPCAWAVARRAGGSVQEF